MRFALATLLLSTLAPLVALGAVLQENAIQVLDNTLAHVSESWKWEDCSDETFGVKIKSIKISPDPPQKGQDLNVTVSGTVKDVVEDGAYVLVQVKIGQIRILQKQFDICEEARNSDSDLKCPVQSGEYTVSQTAQLPKEIPPGKFRVVIDGFTVDEDPLVCVNIDVDFRPKFPRVW